MVLDNVDRSKLTPAMKQFVAIKEQHPDCVLLFRMGDFYETFYDDAELCAKELQITLTSRGKGDTKAPLAGIPYHALQTHLPKLVKRGYKVAIVEQLEDPKKAKGVVKRGVVRIVTPGTVLESNILDQKSNNYLMALYYHDKHYGIAVSDISTGEFKTTQLADITQVKNEILRFRPAEIILPHAMKDSEFLQGITSVVNPYDDYSFKYKQAYKTLIMHFDTMSLEGYGIEDQTAVVCAAGGLISYLNETQQMSVPHITTIKQYHTEDYVILDGSTIRNLELLHNITDGSSRGSLLGAIDATSNSLGARLLKNWMLHALLSREKIHARLHAVEVFTKDVAMREQLRNILGSMYDLERLISRVSHGSANPRDLIALKNSLALLPQVQSTLSEVNDALLKDSCAFADLSSVVALLNRAIKEDASATVRTGNVINDGYSEKLDEIRKVAHGGKDWVLELEQRERENTGIKSLRVSFNKVFGYFIEVTKTNLHLVPDSYIRKQTTANGERYITEELKEKEALILGAEEKILLLEQELFTEVLQKVAVHIGEIQHAAHCIAQLDVLSSFAYIAAKMNYVKPEVVDEYICDLEDSRHPVVEQMVEDYFVPNSVLLNNSSKLHIITGPNMAGKSTFMRQVAQIQLLAQIGSFVPAKSATIGIVDRIFTRVGAYDDLSSGQSTFMVEMHETAHILNNATEKSLIILDEIGRGTSTYDGVSIAWSVAEYIYEKLGSKCLFATHYHALNKLADVFPGIDNFNIAVKEVQGDIIFLRRIIKGGTDKSYGIEVAKLAGLPKEVISRSRKVIAQLEKDDAMNDKITKKKGVVSVKEVQGNQLSKWMN